MSSSWRVVLQVDTPSQSECLRFSDIAVADPVHIAIVTDDRAAAPQAERLYRRLRSMLHSLSRGASKPSPCGHARLLACAARAEPSCRSLLVVVTGSAVISKPLRSQMIAWRATRRDRSEVLPILPAGTSPPAILPPPLDQLTALYRTGPVEQLAPDVLLAAGIGGAKFRLFLSYRRADTQDLAEQLHDGLTHAGFHVFLDRFRGSPGRPFPRVLAEELADKGLLLVLESQHVQSSPWTLAEVAYARALRLGLLALAVPTGRPFAVIPAKDRHQPDPFDWSSKPGTGPSLTDAGRRKLVDFVRERYAEQTLYRQLYLENLLHRCLASKPLLVAAKGGGSFHVSGGAAEYLLHLSSRPPRIGEVRRAIRAAPPAAHSAVVGAHRYLPPEDAADLKWLADRLGASILSEGRLPRLAADLLKGQVPL